MPIKQNTNFKDKVINRLNQIKEQIHRKEYTQAMRNISNTIEFLESERTKRILERG